MSEKFYFCAIRYKDGFIKAMTISQTHQPAVSFALKNLGFYVALLSVQRIKELYANLGITFEFEQTQKNPSVES